VDVWPRHHGCQHDRHHHNGGRERQHQRRHRYVLGRRYEQCSVHHPGQVRDHGVACHHRFRHTAHRSRCRRRCHRSHQRHDLQLILRTKQSEAVRPDLVSGYRHRKVHRRHRTPRHQGRPARSAELAQLFRLPRIHGSWQRSPMDAARSHFRRQLPEHGRQDLALEGVYPGTAA